MVRCANPKIAAAGALEILGVQRWLGMSQPLDCRPDITLHVECQCLAEEAEQLVLPCSQDDLVVNVSNVDPFTDQVNLQRCSLEIVNNRSMAAKQQL